MSSDDVRLDWQRNDRLGISEAVWGLHKSVDQIVAILEAFAARDQPALVTRVDEAKAQAVLQRCNTALVRFEARARCLTSGTPPTLRPELGTVTVLSGGTSDLPVAAEAQLALHWHGIDAGLLLDVGGCRLASAAGSIAETAAVVGSDCLRWDGRCPANRARWPIAPTSDRCARVGGLWSQCWRTGCSRWNACQLCSRPSGGQY